MKTLLTVIGIGCVLCASGAVQAIPQTIHLDSTGDWSSTSGVWDPNDVPNESNENAYFDRAAGYIVTVDGTYSYRWTAATYSTTVRFSDDDASAWTLTSTQMTISGADRAVTLTMDDEAQGSNAGSWTVAGAMNLTPGASDGRHAKYLLSDGTLNVQGTATLTGDSNNEADAIIEVSDGATFAPYSLDLRGDTDSTDGYAVLIFNDNVTVDSGNNHTDPDTLMHGFVDVTLGENTTFDAHDVSLNANTDLQVTGSNATSSVFRFGSVTDNNAADKHFVGPLVVEGY